jgi:hypothetical protein
LQKIRQTYEFEIMIQNFGDMSPVKSDDLEKTISYEEGWN